MDDLMDDLHQEFYQGERISIELILLTGINKGTDLHTGATFFALYNMYACINITLIYLSNCHFT